MAKKFYAVKNGKVPGIYTSWEDCKAQVSNFPGCDFKGFETKEEALIYLGVLSEDTINTSETEAIAYTDGSFFEDKFSYGVIIFWKGEKYTFCESFSDSALVSMRNVAGEIKGAEFVFDFCVKHNIKSVELFYDYQGVEKWCTGEWKRNKDGTQKYHEHYREISKFLTVKFTKVKGHSGDKYNDEADKLAKSALGINGSIINVGVSNK